MLLTEILRDTPSHGRVLRPLVPASLVFSASSLGCAREAEIGKHPEPANLTAIVFQDITHEAGLSDFRHVTGARGQKWMPETMGAGVAIIDYDNDGWPDILLVAGGGWDESGLPSSALQLFRNNRDGTFTDVTDQAGLGGVVAYGFGITVGDYNNSGYQDFYFTTLGENMLFRNDGGRFTEVGGEAGVAGPPEWSTAAIFFDADRDGCLDLHVGNYVVWSPEGDLFCARDGVNKSYCTPEIYPDLSGRYYRNNGDGTFTEMTGTAGFLAYPGKTLGLAELDVNGDGWPDLFVANDTQKDLLYINNGAGAFTEEALNSGVAYDSRGRARAGMGVDIGDVENVGYQTIFIGHFSNQMLGVFRHVGDGLFLDRAPAARLGQPSMPTLTFGLFLVDVDNDGYLDLFLANGHVEDDIQRTMEDIRYRQPAQLFRNQGDGTFAEVFPGVLSTEMVARGAAYADINKNGRPDIILTENGGPIHIWRNDTAGGNYLRVALEGTVSNKSGIGSAIIAHVGDRRLERRVRSGSSYLSSSELTASFGLGTASHIDSLVVIWPSGLIERFGPLDANKEIVLREGDTGNVPG